MNNEAFEKWYRENIMNIINYALLNETKPLKLIIHNAWINGALDALSVLQKN